MICKSCGFSKSIDSFRIRSGKPHLRHLQCRDCEKVYHARYREQNPDKRYLSCKKWKLNNKDKVLLQESRYREFHKDTISVSHKRYASTPEAKNKRRVYENNRRAKKNNSGFVSEAEWNDLVIFYGSICLCCKSKDDLTQDHVIPVSVGGKHSVQNLQPLCQSCNSKKRTKTIDYRPYPYVERTWIEV